MMKESLIHPPALPAYDGSSQVEALELERSGRKPVYAPHEKIPVIEVPNFPMLGKLAALRFIEWVQKNPNGVIALPTGRTPEHLIKWVTRILGRWESAEIRKMLEESGVDPSCRPDMESLTFVQIDEFYPMDATQHNSFNWYVNEFYIKGFGLSARRALLINATSLGLPPGRTMQEVFPDNIVDLTLRVRHTHSDLEQLQKEVINRVDEWCMEYETKIRTLGGIGFFLGGIGPDGHIAFNVRGSSVHSVTRLTGTNYETQAAAATDLGGIEISRSRLVITIGLATITYNPTATAIIMAAGEAKAPIVADAVQEKKSPRYPASVLQDLPNARFYLTKGAASRLAERKFEDFQKTKSVSEEAAQNIVISLSLNSDKQLFRLTEADFQGNPMAAELLRKTGKPCDVLAREAREGIIRKIQKGIQPLSRTIFLHTEPHQDDIMLAYQAYIYHLVRDPSNQHYFANLTSGFTSVSNAYMSAMLEKLDRYLESGLFTPALQAGYFDPADKKKRMQDVYLYLDGTASKSLEMKEEAEARRLFRSLIELYSTSDVPTLRNHVRDMLSYLHTQYPGAKDPQNIQTLKGMIREWEVELLWAHLGIESSAVHALRLGFYTGDIFSQEPEENRDVLPIYELLKQIKPNVVSVAFDPEGSGPDTHYKALQAVAEALKLYARGEGSPRLRVWGYRNVWYRFTPGECNLMIPVSLNSFSTLQSTFLNCFGSQRAASFPSYEHDGPFSDLAQRIQAEQYKDVKTCLGDDHFLKSDHPRLRAAHGMIFLREMELVEFFDMVRELKKKTENKD